MANLKIVAVDFTDGINKLGGRMSMGLVRDPRIALPTAKAFEASTFGVLVTYGDKVILVPWSKIACCDVEVEEPEARPVVQAVKGRA